MLQQNKPNKRKKSAQKLEWKQFLLNGAKVSADVLASAHPELSLLIQSLGKNEEISISIKTNGAQTVAIASAWHVCSPSVQLELDLLPQSA